MDKEYAAGCLVETLKMLGQGLAIYGGLLALYWILVG